MDLGATGTSLTTSRVTSRVCVRPGPPNITRGPRSGKPEPPEEDGALLGFALDFPEEDFRSEEDSERPLPPAPNTKNKTATITTAATVKKTMIAVNRRARGMLYNS